VYRFRQHQPDGRSKKRSVLLGEKCTYKTEAEAWRAAEHLRLGANPENLNGATVTLGALVDRYMAEEMPQRHSTRKGYRAYLLKYIKPRWGNYPVIAVKPFPVREWLKQLPLAPKTKAHLRGLLKQLCDFAMLWELVPFQNNPMKLVRIEGASKREREPSVLTVEQFQQLLSQLNDEPYRTMLLTALCLGLRCSELVGLRWGDIDFLAGEISIQRAVVENRVGDVKTRYSRAKAPLDPGFARVLLAWKSRTSYPGEMDWVFPNPAALGKTPLRPDTALRYRIRPAAKKVGLAKLGWHDLRHTYRTWLDETGAPLKVQQELMRHADIRTTMNIYGAALSESKRKANSKVVEMALRGTGANSHDLQDAVEPISQLMPPAAP
jgi:integrase